MKSKKAPVAKVKAQPVSSGMNLNDIESLIKFVQSSGVSEVSLEQKDFKLTIKTSHGASIAPVHNPAVHQFVHTPAPLPPAIPLPSEKTAPAAEKAAVTDDNKYVTIKSPMIGTFYRASTPEKPVFVNVGDEIKPGKVLCIIEAMKLFNEIESEVAGKIVKVLVDNATPVEYDQPLFLVDPS